MNPALSLVIPFCNVEPYLAACLDSIIKQTFVDFEVIMIDDGSTDTSREIADSYTRKDPRFRLFRQPNRGPGPARNAGLRHASGRYIGFVDSDDIVAEDAYEQLIDSLQHTGSDVACGGVRRFNRERSWPSPLHEGIFDIPEKRTHITQRIELLGDRTVWNKIYRRSFWDRNNLRFPDHIFEDAFVTVPAHVLAESVDIVTGPVYFWRQREDGPPSITQRALDGDVIYGRMKQIRMVSDFLASQNLELKKAYDLVALEHDILILLTALPNAEHAQREDIITFARDFISRVAEGVLRELESKNAKCYRLLNERRLNDLFQYLKSLPPTDFL
ncbi:glycosyltransferase family 2 protein [Streptomyces fuscichromogenes]|uniref:glycosyltransferase family 2 protein n=1 Tax=Streptomyces fuscichromogenes TaxID=1324013 RepID=UPI00381B0113